MLRDLVLYADLLVGAVDGVVGSCLVRLRVCAATGSFAVVLFLSVLGVGLVKALSTLGYGVVISGTLRDEGMSDSIYGGGIGTGFGTLEDVCSFLSSVVCVKISGCAVGAVLWAVGAWRLIRLLAAVVSQSRSLIYAPPFHLTGLLWTVLGSEWL